MPFRALYARNLRTRALDLALHIVCAVILPGSWWMQFVPDLVLPVLWGHGMVTDRFLPVGHPLLRVHRVLHLRHMHSLYLFLAAVFLLPALALHLAAHAFIDLFTHGEPWQ